MLKMWNMLTRRCVFQVQETLITRHLTTAFSLILAVRTSEKRFCGPSNITAHPPFWGICLGHQSWKASPPNINQWQQTNPALA